MLRLGIMMLTVAATAACATTGATPRPFPGATVVTTAPTAPVASDPQDASGATVGRPAAPVAPTAPDLPVIASGASIAQFAMGFRGVPYRLGGSDPDGFDCSGLVQYVFAQYGIAVPRVVEEQYQVGDKVKSDDIEPGDLIFFNTKRRGRGVSHVAIAIGGDSFVHAPNSTGVVRVETLNSSYWGSRYVGARRVGFSSTSN